MDFFLIYYAIKARIVPFMQKEEQDIINVNGINRRYQGGTADGAKI